jgi:hypothetical protein
MSQVVVTIIRGGDSLVLTTSPYSLANWDGWGLPPMHRLTSRGPMQHGASDEGFRLDPRAITLAINVDADDVQGIYDHQAELMEFFKPSDTAIILRVEYPGGRTRQIDCYADQGLTFPTSAWEGWFQTVPVRLICDDPTWYNPTGEAVTFALGAGGSSGVVPYTVPYYVGASTLDVVQTVDYDGTWLTYPTMRITGPIRDCIITNEGTSETLSFSGTTIGAGTYLELDLRYGYKTVVDSAGANQIALLTTNSDLVTWHLAADPEVADGVNSITVQGNGAGAATKIELAWFERHIGC